ncbi:hypothetical protein JTE90_022428 [Oedothorax gibbosus]|uniref:Uncharacterized protein n=1 Tax=Oedothorax gibbosus TaxID=931172 RepID=A0AAV6TRS5_9ARAC|nr:hypothetical protein JTE90_022428 [Oedothorax gibbosus]
MGGAVDPAESPSPRLEWGPARPVSPHWIASPHARRKRVSHAKGLGLSLKSLPTTTGTANPPGPPPQAPSQPSQSGPKKRSSYPKSVSEGSETRRLPSHTAHPPRNPNPHFPVHDSPHGLRTQPLPPTSEPPAESAQPSPTTKTLFAEIVQSAPTPRTTSASTAHEPIRPDTHHIHTDPPNSPIMCHICKAGPFRNIPLKDLHVEFAHSRKVPRVILQHEKIFMNSNLPPTHLPPNDQPVRVKSGPSSLPGFLSPAPPTADSQDLFQAHKPKRRGRPPASSGTTPTTMTHPPHAASRSGPPGGLLSNAPTRLPQHLRQWIVDIHPPIHQEAPETGPPNPDPRNGARSAQAFALTGSLSTHASPVVTPPSDLAPTRLSRATSASSSAPLEGSSAITLHSIVMRPCVSRDARSRARTFTPTAPAATVTFTLSPLPPSHAEPASPPTSWQHQHPPTGSTLKVRLDQEQLAQQPD